MMIQQQHQRISLALPPTWQYPPSASATTTTATLNHYNTNPPVTVAPRKLKVLVLGGAGAGKTSILRRYFGGTFHHERIPTMGSDFYTKKIPNPRRNVGIGNSSTQGSPGVTQALNQHQLPKREPNVEDDSTGREEKKTVDATMLVAPPSSYGTDGFANLLHPQRRNGDDPFATAEFISVQVWDTPGRERFLGPNRQKPIYTAAFSDSFFQNADVALLVYDITSSTSFTQLLHWHEDLTERMQRFEQKKAQRSGNERFKPLPILIVANKMDLFATLQQQSRQLQPIERHGLHCDNGNGSTSPNVEKVLQRDVMGFKGENFRGKDSRYEYRVSAPTTLSPQRRQTNKLSVGASSSSSSLSRGKSPLSPTSNIKGKRKDSKDSTNSLNNTQNHRFEILTYMGTGSQTSYLKKYLQNECVRGSYLESLLSTEDRSHPDKDMVLLWCMRNGLKHVEVSAMDGT